MRGPSHTAGLNFSAKNFSNRKTSPQKTDVGQTMKLHSVERALMERENTSKEHAQKFTLWVPIKSMSLKATWVRSTYWFWWASRIGRVAAGGWEDGISHLVFCFTVLTPALASLLVIPLAYWGLQQPDLRMHSQECGETAPTHQSPRKPHEQGILVH